MKAIYRIFIFTLLLGLMASCNREELALELTNVELSAIMESGAKTKTTLSGLEEGMYYPLWSAGDEIAVYVDGDSSPVKFTLKSGEESTEATFSGTRDGESYCAIYPFSAAEVMQNGTISLTLSQTQQYVAASFGPDSYPMIAQGSDGVLNFKNLCAVMKVSIKGEAAIRSITLVAKDSAAILSGSATVDANNTSSPVLKMAEGGSNSLTLECSGIELSKDNATDFHFVIPAQSYKGGFEIVIDTYTEQITKTVSADLEFKRSQIRHLKGMELGLELSEHEKQLAKEKAALIAIYNALDGDNWNNNTNWCSDKPIDEWYGVSVDYKSGYVIRLELYFNNAQGEIPSEIENLEHLTYLRIGDTKISHIPKEIGKLINLNYLSIGGHAVKTTPKEIDNLVHLTSIDLWGENVVDFQPTLSTLVNLIYARVTINSGTGFISGLAELKNLKSLSYSSNMTQFPDEIRRMTQLERLDFTYSNMQGVTIPSWLSELTNLKYLSLFGCGLIGEIPEDLGNLVKIEQLELGVNNLSGSIPSSFSNLKQLRELNIKYNNLSGEIPESIVGMPWFQYRWGEIVLGNQFSLDNIKLCGPEFMVVDIYGKTVDSKKIYEENKYTIFYQWRPSEYIETTMLLKNLYEKYHEKGLEIIADTGDSFAEIAALDTPWINFIRGNGNHIYVNDDPYYTIDSYPMRYWGIPCITVIDSCKNVVYSNLIDDMSVDAFLSSKFDDIDYYISTDYSQDGVSVTLQSASEGNGINIVLLGDGYSDRQIADGTYKRDMEFAYSNLFTEEPYRSYKNLFNVSYVNAVSATEGFEHGNTALSCGFGEGTYVYGNDDKCFAYAQNVVASQKMNETLVVVVLNSDRYAGTCFMYYPGGYSNDYGSGPAVAYFPKGTDESVFAQLLHHEACGHGFAKLADEYSYEYMGEVPAEEVTGTKDQQANWGWWKNVDFTDDKALVRWAKFLSDARYQYDGLGVFEGGMTYWSGVWRPTENSIMRHNYGGFNAPSREAIYHRIHKLAYGEDWEYDYEKFVEYDAKNRKSSAEAAVIASQVLPLEPMKPTHPPVVIPHSWN